MYDLYSLGSTLCGCFAAIWIWNMYEHIMPFVVPISCPQDVSGSITVHLQEMISHLIDPLTGKVRVRLRVNGFHCKSLKVFSFSKFPLVPFSDLSNLELHGKKHNRMASTRGMTPPPLQVSTGTYSPSYQMNRSWRCILRRCDG